MDVGGGEHTGGLLLDGMERLGTEHVGERERGVGVEHRHVDALPAPGALAREQRRDHRGGRGEPVALSAAIPRTSAGSSGVPCVCMNPERPWITVS